MSPRPATRTTRPSWRRIGLHARRRPASGRQASRDGRRAQGSPVGRSKEKLSTERRRRRALLIGACAFSLVVLVTSLPLSALLTQRSQISQTALQLRQLEDENRTLKQETTDLRNPSVVADIARRDYGLVSPGSQAYEILPAPGSSGSASQGSGHVPLDGPPVVPGSAQSQALLGAGALSGVAPGATTAGSASGGNAAEGRPEGSSHGGGITPKGGFWTRVADTLEFWR